MRKIILLLIMLLLVSLFLFSVEAIDDKKPSLKVIYQRNKDAISPGEIIRVSIYFPGDGNISLCRCTFYYNGQFYDNITYRTPENITRFFYITEGVVTTFEIPNDIFDPLTDAYWSPTQAETGAKIEESGPSVAPLRLWLNTKSDIPPGNHYIILFLSYTDGKEWFTYEKNIEFHVNNFFEENPWFIPLIIAIVGWALGFVSKVILDRKKIKKYKK